MTLLHQATAVARSSPQEVLALGLRIGRAPADVATAIRGTDRGPVRWSSSRAAPEYRDRVARAVTDVDAQLGQLSDGGAAVVRYAEALERSRQQARQGVLQLHWGRGVVDAFRPFASTSPPALQWCLRGLATYGDGAAASRAAVTGLDAAAAELHATLGRLHPQERSDHA